MHEFTLVPLQLNDGVFVANNNNNNNYILNIAPFNIKMIKSALQVSLKMYMYINKYQ